MIARNGTKCAVGMTASSWPVEKPGPKLRTPLAPGSQAFGLGGWDGRMRNQRIELEDRTGGLSTGTGSSGDWVVGTLALTYAFPSVGLALPAQPNDLECWVECHGINVSTG